jgi:hypothetical protein
MRTSKFLGVVGAGLFALTLGAQQSGALTMTPTNHPTPGISQVGKNINSTDQSAHSKAETKQKNVNLPVSFLSIWSNNGDVHQSNGAITKAESTNDNSTWQNLDQSQKVSPETHRSKPGPKPEPKPTCKPTTEKNSDGGGYPGGDKPDGDKKPGGDEAGNVSQRGSNDNWTSQNARSKATTKQVNVNAPISVLSFDSNNGDVKQGNAADTSAKSSNDNGTGQWLGQSQGVKGGGNGDVSQSGKNENSTDQHAKSDAKTQQANINAPISILSFGANNGDVRQSNWADTKAKSSNDNWTDQSLHQNQSVSGQGSPGGSPGGPPPTVYDSGNNGPKGPDGSGGNGDVSQSGKNENSTDQYAKSDAKTEQKNVNLPISILSFGANNGDVHQGNAAGTFSGSSNSNGTQQQLGQGQNVGSVPLFG